MSERSCSECGVNLVPRQTVGDSVVNVAVAVAASVMVLLLAVTISPGPPARLTACKQNLHAIAAALELYSGDHGGYPPELSRLTPRYLKSIPACPAAGKDTYSTGYSCRQGFSFSCRGLNHARVGITAADYPRFHPRHGVVERP
ncbi:MAG: hypothetical protein AB1758_00810 [Candidatus Eremiobacterota bacterium]